MPYIQFFDNNRIKYYQLPNNKPTVFGRGKDVDFQILTDRAVSRNHFAVGINRDKDFVLADLGANNGSYLNGYLLKSKDVVLLKDNYEISAGDKRFVFLEKVPDGEENKIINKHIEISSIPSGSDLPDPNEKDIAESNTVQFKKMTKDANEKIKQSLFGPDDI